jgi:hypothetical protein
MSEVVYRFPINDEFIVFPPSHIYNINRQLSKSYIESRLTKTVEK